MHINILDNAMQLIHFKKNTLRIELQILLERKTMYGITKPLEAASIVPIMLTCQKPSQKGSKKEHKKLARKNNTTTHSAPKLIVHQNFFFK